MKNEMKQFKLRTAGERRFTNAGKTKGRKARRKEWQLTKQEKKIVKAKIRRKELWFPRGYSSIKVIRIIERHLSNTFGRSKI